MNSRRLGNLVVKEWRELIRDRIFFSMAFLLPPMMMLLFGYGMSQDVQNVPFAILDYDHTKLSREFSQHFIDSRFFRFKGYLRSEEELERRITSGEVRFVVTIPERFQQRIYAGLPADVQTILDGTFLITIRSTRGYVNAVAAAAGAAIQTEYIAAHAGIPMAQAAERMQPLRVEARYLYNQQLRSVWGIAPLLIMVILMWASPMLMAISVVRERESGAIYNIYSSTITRAEFLVGKMTPVAGVCLFNCFVLWLLAVLYYQTPFRGSFSCFAVAALFFSLSVTALGLLISVVVRTQLAALMVSIMLGSIIASQYSGINVPISDLTGMNYWLAHLFPAMYFTDVVEFVFLKGGGWPEVWMEVGALALYSGAVFAVCYRFFHKRTAA